MPKPALTIVRIYRDDGSAILLWPMEPSDSRPGNVTCWQFIGQHGAATLSRVIADTRLATAEEAAEAVRLYRSSLPPDVGSEAVLPFRIIKRAPAWGAIMAAHGAALAEVGR